MSEAQDTFTRVTFDRGLPFLELHVYTAGLIGFLFFYGLEHMVSRSGQKDGGEGARLGYRLQLGGFVAYSGLVGYLMVHQRTLPTLLYVVAMALHFLSIDHSLGREYGAAYHRVGRWVLAAAVLLGGATGIATSMSEALLATLLGLNSGGVIINSMIMELPKEKEGRFWPFCFGAVAYSVLLLLV
jgi:Kef-type K+ transport system membrane component KefB